MRAATVDSWHLKSEGRQSDEMNLFKAMRVQVIECESFPQKVVLFWRYIVCEIVWF